MSTNQNPELEGVMRRIQKLLAIANDDRINSGPIPAHSSVKMIGGVK